MSQGLDHFGRDTAEGKYGLFHRRKARQAEESARHANILGQVCAGLIVPTLRVVTPPWTLCVRLCDAERHGLHSHAEHGNEWGMDQFATRTPPILPLNSYAANSA
ncbi:hypothetical protein FPT12_26450 [Pseudomonas sp. H3(2019)]|nr:hypothetical protein FPT12_26450 [Pseudomonas sp. H3(2019)]